MEKKSEVQHSAAFNRKRKFFLVLPLLILPFLTMIGYATGMIGSTTNDKKNTPVIGFNMKLPEAAPVADSSWDKLKFYEKADEDSARRLSAVRADPYYSAHGSSAKLSDTVFQGASGFTYDPYPAELNSSQDANEAKVFKKLAELDKELNQQDLPANAAGQLSTTTNNPDIDRLEKMMSSFSAEPTNPELTQINGLLEKILDVQHPSRVRDKIRERSESQKTAVFPVTVQPDEANFTVLVAGQKDTAGRILPVTGNGFYGLSETVSRQTVQRSIRAVIPIAQAIVSGATVKLMLMDDVYVRGNLIPRYSDIYGKVAIGEERVRIEISSIQYKNNIYPVALSVYNLDGLEGMYIPGSITRDVAKESTDQAMQGLGIASLDPSLGTQAATAGIQAAKSLIGKKTKLIQVTIPGGYEVLLCDNNAEEK